MELLELNCSWIPELNCSTLFRNNSQYISLYEVPVGVVLLLSVFYGTISIVAVVGNSLVIWIVVFGRKMQNVTNCFIANLALADIVIALFAIPFQFQAALLQRWNLPYFMCPFCPFVQVLTVNVSIFTLTAIAVDRYRAILNPLRMRQSKLWAKTIIASIWVVAGVLATPMAIAFRVTDVEEESGGTVIMKPFCHNVIFSEVALLTYRVILVLVQYVMPLCIISCVYARTALTLWGSRAPGNAQDSRDANLMKKRKKVIKMLVIVVALFALCWLPLQTYNVLQNIIPDINAYHYINIIWFSFDWLAMSNSCYNPFIYGIYNEKFKREFQQRFTFRKRKWNQSGMYGDSADFDRTFTHNMRSSVHSTSLTTTNSTYEWRRGYSTRPPSHSTTANGNNVYRQVSVREPSKSKKGSNLVVYRSKDSKIIEPMHSGQYDPDALCL